MIIFLLANFLTNIKCFEVVDCDICSLKISPAFKEHTEEDVIGSHACIKNGNSFEEGESYRHSHLRYVCQESVMRILGCYIDENKDLEIGENYVDQERNTAYRCYKKNENVGYQEIYCGTLGFNEDSTYCKPAGKNTASEKISTHNHRPPAIHKNENRCTKNGLFFNEGDIYRNGHLKYKCESGNMKIKGCIIGHNKDLEVGKSHIDNEAKTVVYCQKENGKIGFKEVSCGATGFNKNRTDCQGISEKSSQQIYSTISQHKVYVVKDQLGDKIDQEKAIHVDCDCD